MRRDCPDPRRVPRRPAGSAMGAMCAAIALVASAAAQRPALGSPAPLLPARDFQGAERSLKDYAGPRGLVVCFWAAWSERSIEELRSLDAARRELAEHGVGVVAVNVDHYRIAGEPVQAVQADATKLGLSIPILMDDGLKLFNAYGVVAVPSTALVNDQGKLVYFLAGYSHQDREALADAIDRLAGIARTRPAIDVPQAAPAALRRLQLGRLQFAGGRVTNARASFEAAVEADPNFPDPLVDLAALALDDGDLPRARGLLDRALALDPAHRTAIAERARLRFVQNDQTEARKLLEGLASGSTDPLVLAYLGFVLQATGQSDAAVTMFNRAVQAGAPDPRGSLGGDKSAGPAMAAYRRALAARRR